MFEFLGAVERGLESSGVCTFKVFSFALNHRIIDEGCPLEDSAENLTENILEKRVTRIYWKLRELQSKYRHRHLFWDTRYDNGSRKDLIAMNQYSN